MGYPELLYESPGEQLRWGVNGPERVKVEEVGPLERLSSTMNNRKGIGGTTPTAKTYQAAPPAGPAEVTPEELMRRAKEVLDATYAQRDVQLANPSLGERNNSGDRIPSWLTMFMKNQ